MNFFRKLSTSRRPSEASASCASGSSNVKLDGAGQTSEIGAESTSDGRTRTMSLGNIFSRSRSKTHSSESYTTDFWERNFFEKTIVSWNEFRAAFVLDYKNGLEEFSNTGHLNSVLSAAHDELCNKQSIVYIARYRKFVGPDTSPDAMWNRIKDKAMRIVFDEGVMDSLCL